MNPAASSSSSKSSLDDYVFHTFRSFLQVIVQGRRAQRPSSQQKDDKFAPEPSTWLNYFMYCLSSVDDDLQQIWLRRDEKPLIEVMLDIFVRATSRSPKGPEPCLLERWQLSFDATATGGAESRARTIATRTTAMVLRSVGCTVRALPTHKLVRLCRKQDTSYDIGYTLYQPSSSTSPRCEWAATAVKQTFPFNSMVSRSGTFTIAVEYTTNPPSLKKAKIKPVMITDYMPSSDPATNYARSAPTEVPIKRADGGEAPHSVAIPIRGANSPFRIKGEPNFGRGEDMDTGAMIGASPNFGGFPMSSQSPTPSPGADLLSRKLPSMGKSGPCFNFSSTPPLSGECFLGYHPMPRSSLTTSPFLEEKSGSSLLDGTHLSTSIGGSIAGDIFPTLLPSNENLTDHLQSSLLSLPAQETEVSSFLNSVTHPPDLKMFSQSKNMVANLADELRVLGEGTEDLETLSRSLRRLSTDLSRRTGTSKSPSRDASDDLLFFNA